MSRCWKGLVLAVGLAASLAWPERALAGPRHIAPRDWHDAKCAHYRMLWSQALARSRQQELGKPFLDAHAAFLDSNCTRRADVCPRSEEELRLANLLVVATMNYGTASTFVPFACR